jgi:hypothetical protein
MPGVISRERPDSADASGLCERMGFSLVPPFGEYREDPLSRFYEKKLGEA